MLEVEKREAANRQIYNMKKEDGFDSYRESDPSFLMCHSKNNPPAMQGEESSLDERTPMLE